RLAGRRLLHRQLHSTGDERQRLDLYPELGALEPAGCGHAGGPGSGEPHAEDRQPQHRTRDQHGGRRPPLPVRRRRDHDDVGVGENVLFGGADPGISNLVPSDIEFRKNYLVKPLSWRADGSSYAGIHWSVNNIFELKNAQRILVDGNLFENNWTDAQNGYGIL